MTDSANLALLNDTKAHNLVGNDSLPTRLTVDKARAKGSNLEPLANRKMISVVHRIFLSKPIITISITMVS